MKNSVKMYYVEYYCPLEEDRLFKLKAEYQLKKYGSKLTREDFYEDGGERDSFVFSENYINKKDAYDFAKKQSKKNNHFAYVCSGWFEENNLGELELEEIDEDFCEQFCEGKVVV